MDCQRWDAGILCWKHWHVMFKFGLDENCSDCAMMPCVHLDSGFGFFSTKYLSDFPVGLFSACLVDTRLKCRRYNENIAHKQQLRLLWRQECLLCFQKWVLQTLVWSTCITHYSLFDCCFSRHCHSQFLLVLQNPSKCFGFCSSVQECFWARDERTSWASVLQIKWDGFPYREAVCEGVTVLLVPISPAPWRARGCLAGRAAAVL